MPKSYREGYCSDLALLSLMHTAIHSHTGTRIDLLFIQLLAIYMVYKCPKSMLNIMPKTAEYTTKIDLLQMLQNSPKTG